MSVQRALEERRRRIVGTELQPALSPVSGGQLEDLGALENVNANRRNGKGRERLEKRSRK